MDPNENNRNRPQPNPWYVGLGVGVGVGVITAAGLLGKYLFSRNSNNEENGQSAARTSSQRPSFQSQPSQRQPSQSQQRQSQDNGGPSYMEILSQRLLNSCQLNPSLESCAPENPVITNLNSLLHDIYVRYLKLQEFEKHYKVFYVIFNDLHRKMKDVDPYYRKYSSTVQFAGSHFDKLRNEKPDEFDMDIVISLPLNYNVDAFNPANSDIILEAKGPGFVQLKMGVQFEKLPMRDLDEWPNNKAAYEWKDSCNYLLRSNFIAWFEGVVNLALNQYTKLNSRPVVYVEGVAYVINVSKSGPAMTLLIRNYERNFSLDVDLVPALRFPESRWPISRAYRSIPAKCSKGYWLVVPKPNKESSILQDQTRAWRIGLHNQERELMYDSHNLKQTIRLIKKLRDSLEMKKIASYYIKTIFFWEIEAINNEEYWRSSPAVLFKRMVGKLYEVLVTGNIPYYWNKNNNLIGGVSRGLLDTYAKRLIPLMSILEEPSKYKLVAKYLLSNSEFNDYNRRFLHI